jgi:hypothetical protein
VNSEETGSVGNGDHCCDSHLNYSAAKLDVYRHERLAYTEPPQKIAPPRRSVSERASALLKAMSGWALAHF